MMQIQTIDVISFFSAQYCESENEFWYLDLNQFTNTETQWAENASTQDVFKSNYFHIAVTFKVNVKYVSKVYSGDRKIGSTESRPQ